MENSNLGQMLTKYNRRKNRQEAEKAHQQWLKLPKEKRELYGLLNDIIQRTDDNDTINDCISMKLVIDRM